MSIKAALKTVIPHSMLRIRRRVSERRFEQEIGSDDPARVFEAVYSRGLWGGGEGEGFFSGAGSHDPRIVEPYLLSIEKLVRDLPEVRTAVDLGCGDFAVGRLLAPLFDAYAACDVVPSLIEHHQAAYATDRIRFLRLDITSEAPPTADIAFVRQVFQHLSNPQISRAAARLAAYRYVVITEHLPAGRFTPNLEKPAGPGIRLSEGSGIDLTCPPFNLMPLRREMLCSVESETGGIVRTDLFEFDSNLLL